MKRVTSQFTAAAFAVLIPTSMAFAYSDDAVKEAEQLVELVTAQFNRGTAKQTDVEEAQYYLLEMRYRAGKISRATYCQSGVQTLNEEMDLVHTQYLRGIVDLATVLNSGRRFYKLKAFCEERKHSE